MNAQSSSTSAKIWSPVFQGILTNLAMAAAVYALLGFFSGVGSSTRWIASLVFLAFGLLVTVVIGVSAYLDRRWDS